MKRFGLAILTAVMATPAWAQITVDGTVDAAYGPAIVVQTVQTQFGDASPPGSLGGSELDAAYARISGGRLYLMLTGNHEPNFNKLDIFIDSKAGGENTLANKPEYDFNPGGGWISKNLAGLTFDTGFTADYHLLSRWGSGTGSYEVDFVDRQGGVAAQVPGSKGGSPNAVGLIAAGSISAGNVGTNASATALTQNLAFAINDNNAAGVTGGTGQTGASEAPQLAAASAVTTGMEFSIALADLGNPQIGSQICIVAAINNGDHNYLSNQILGGLASPQGNLGGNGSGGGGPNGTLGGVNFNQFAGDQFFCVRVVPEPASLAMAGLAFAGLAIRRRK